MRFLIITGLAIGAVLLSLPWIKSHVDDAGFRQDIAFAPGLVAGRHGVEATMVADAVRARARDRGIALPDDGVRVTVSEARKGRYNVQGGIMRVAGPPAGAVQDVTVSVSYDQPLFWLFKRHVETQVETSAPGSGPASSYPAEAKPDAPPE